MEAYAGIDLHASNNYTAVIDDHDKRLYGKGQPNRLDIILSALDPFKEDLKVWWLNRHSIGTGW